jgi:tetratricopeptide (TPR) repeat protein
MVDNNEGDFYYGFSLFISYSPLILGLNITQASTNFKTFLENSFNITIYLIFFLFLLISIRWIFAKEEIVILPFDASTNNMNGKAISDLLVHELREIDRIHKTKRYLSVGSVKTANVSIPLANKSLAWEVSSFGSIALGSISLSLGQFLIFLKRLFPYADAGRVITGSLQEYGSSYAVVARMESKDIYNEGIRMRDIRTWIVVGEDSKEIIISIKELAFKIATDLSTGASAKTWIGLKHFTDALDAFDQYLLGSNIDELEKSKGLCFNALKNELSYSKPYNLLYCIAQEYLNKELYKDAETLLKEIIKSKHGPDIAAFYLLGNVYENGLAKKDIDDRKLAQNYFESALKRRPRDAIDWSYMGQIFLHKENYDEAIKAYDEVIRLDPEDATAWNSKGYALAKKGDDLKKMRDEANKAYYEETIRLCDKANEKDPSYSMPLINKGYALIRLGGRVNCEEAIKVLDKAIELDPNLAEPWINKGYALNSQKNYDEAIKAYNEALRLDPKDAKAWRNKGEALRNQSNFNEAVRAYEKAIDIDSNDANVWNEKVIALRAAGRTEEANEAFAKAKDLGYTDSEMQSGIIAKREKNLINRELSD